MTVMVNLGDILVWFVLIILVIVYACLYLIDRFK